MQTRVYRPSMFHWIFAVALTGIGIYCMYVPIDHLITGEPWWISNGKHSGGLHIASKGEMYFRTLEYSTFVLVGLFLLYAAGTRSVTIDMDGIVVKGIGGRVRFMERFENLNSIREDKQQIFRRYVLNTKDGRSVVIVDFYKGTQDLLAQLRHRAPQLVSILSSQ